MTLSSHSVPHRQRRRGSDGTFGSEAPGTTYIVPVWDWAPGVYYLQYLEGGAVRAVEGFVKK